MFSWDPARQSFSLFSALLSVDSLCLFMATDYIMPMRASVRSTTTNHNAKSLMMLTVSWHLPHQQPSTCIFGGSRASDVSHSSGGKRTTPAG